MARERNQRRKLAAQFDAALPPTLQAACGPGDACPLLRPGVEMLKTLGRSAPGAAGRPACPDAGACPLRAALARRGGGKLKLEIGAGLGRFITAHARNNPGASIIGLEIERVRVARIDVKARMEGLANITLARADAEPFLEFCAPPEIFDTVFIFFPDPWPRARHEKNRIFRPEVVALIRRALARGGVLHAATDHAAYFARMLEVMSAETAAGRFAEAAPLARGADELTDFELKFLAKGMAVNAAAWRKPA